MHPRRLATVSFFMLVALWASPAMAAGRSFTRSMLLGVWEVTACESPSPRGAGDPASVPNSKYCFGIDEAYPSLSADSSNDSADGGGSYFLVDGDILIIRINVAFGNVRAYTIISADRDQIVWEDGILRVTLRRIAKNWDGRRAPVRKLRSIAIHYAR